MDYIIIFISQLIFQLARTASTINIIKNDVFLAVCLSSVVQLLWLVSTFYGINGMINNDFFVAFFYILGGAIGTYISLKINNKGNIK